MAWSHQCDHLVDAGISTSCSGRRERLYSRIFVRVTIITLTLRLIKIIFTLARGWSSFFYILKGSVLVASDTIPQPAFHTVVLSNEANETGVSLTAAEDDTELVLVCQCFNTTRVLTVVRPPLSGIRRTAGSDCRAIRPLCDDYEGGNPQDA